MEANREFNTEAFAEIVKGTFADLPDYRRNQARVLYPVWFLSLVVLWGCNTIEEIADYAPLQEKGFSSLLTESLNPFLWHPLVVFNSYTQKGFRKIPGALQDQLGGSDGKRLQLHLDKSLEVHSTPSSHFPIFTDPTKIII